MIVAPYKFAGIPQPGEIQPDDEEANSRMVWETAKRLRMLRTELSRISTPYTIPEVGPPWIGDDQAMI